MGPSFPTHHLSAIGLPNCFIKNHLHAISRRIYRAILIGIIVGILVGNVRSAVNAIIIQETIGF